MTWQEVDRLSREVVVVIPTGSLEQHGPHLPLFTDSLLATAAADAVEARLSEETLVTPTLWLGASGHHLAFSGTLSASFEAYEAAILSVVNSLLPHGFYKFYLINGHGGNNEPNAIACRKLKQANPNITIGHRGYYAFADQTIADTLEGPSKYMRHACEAEASLMLHLHPDLVKKAKLRDDGLQSDPPVSGVVHFFDEMTEQGSLGYATLATAEKGKRIFDSAVSGLIQEISTIYNGYVLKGLPKHQ